MGKRKRKVRFLKPCNRSNRIGKQIGRALAGVVDFESGTFSNHTFVSGAADPRAAHLRSLLVSPGAHPDRAVIPFFDFEATSELAKEISRRETLQFEPPHYTYKARRLDYTIPDIMIPPRSYIIDHVHIVHPLGSLLIRDISSDSPSVQGVGVDRGQVDSPGSAEALGTTEPDTGRSQ